MKEAMIFAAGMGTRLRPLTDSMPKALVPVCGKPLLQLAIEKLSLSGFTRIVVNVHHFADMIEDFLAENGNRFPGVSFAISDERDLLRDTGGGIRHACGLLCGEDRFLVHNVDILSDLDLAEFSSKVREDSVATLVVSERKTSRYLLFDDDMRLAGWTNLSTGEVRSPYPGLNPDKYRKLAFSGIHDISREVFSLFDRYGFGERFSIIDFYLEIAADFGVYGYVPDNLQLIDVGKPESLAAAGVFLGRNGCVTA